MDGGERRGIGAEKSVRERDLRNGEKEGRRSVS